MITVQELINEIRIRADLSHIKDEEIMDYINDLDDFMAATYFPHYESIKVTVTGPEQYRFDVADVAAEDQIEKVYIDGKKAIKKNTPDDILDGWHFSGDTVFVSPDLLGENSEVVIILRSRHVPLNIDDTTLAVPEPFHDLYVFYTLAQISSKEADEVSFGNFQKDYNSLLAEAVKHVKNKQAYPEQAPGWLK